MFEIKKPEYINKTFRLPSDLVKKMEVLAQEKQVSLNNLVVQCCEYALDHTPDSKQTVSKSNEEIL
ncbi:MAG: toxin-antitoxin system HicB family antitoxin [Clostridia bacterium]|nr:toxin-antitoxin system HicB family antitoxin [Clostridia bacterium]